MIKIRTHSGKAVIWVLLLAAIAAGAVYYFYFLDRGVEVVEPAPPPILPDREPAAVPEPRQDEDQSPPAARTVMPESEEVVPETEPLPALADSDEEAVEAARGLVGDDPVKSYLVTEAVISRMVATVDALTLRQLPKNIIPVYGPDSKFEVTEDGVSQEINPETGLPEPRFVLNPTNFQRYNGQVEIFEAIDTSSLVAQYNRYYPLLQESYRELGYPEGEFNNRLVAVIDHLLATPDPARPVNLVKPEAYYEFEDPDLENLTAGQKLLIRMGPSNAARVKAKLVEISEALQTQRE